MISIGETRPKTGSGAIGKTFRSVVDGLSGPKSLSVAGFAAIAPLIIIRDVQSQLPYLFGNLYGALAAATAATLATGGVLAIASATILRRRLDTHRSAAVTLAVFAVAGAIGALVLITVNAGIGMPKPQPAITSFVESTLFTVLWLTIASTIANALDQSRDAAERLSAELDHLQLTRDQSQAVLDACRTELANTLNEETRPCVQELRDSVRHLLAVHPPPPAEVGILADSLRSAATDVFKSTGRELSTQEARPHPDVPQSETRDRERPGFRVSSILRRAFTREAIAPIPIWLITFLACSLAIPRPLRFIPSVALGFPLFYGSLILIKYVIPRAVWRSGAVTRFIAASTAYWVAGATTILAPIILVWALPDGWGPYQRDATLDGWWMVLLATSTMICGWIWAIGSTMSRQLAQQRRDLTAAVSTTQWELAQLDTRVAAARHAIAHLVHTDLQGCAAGCAMLLEFALESSDSRSGAERGSAEALTAALQQTEARLDHTLTSLDEALNTQSLAESSDVTTGLTAVAETWSGFVDVEVSIEPRARTCADRRPAVALAVVELVSEAISNAAIHGTARRVNVEVTVLENELEVVARDNGIGLAANPSPGAGSASIDRLTSSWSLRNIEDGGCEFRALIPVSFAE